MTKLTDLVDYDIILIPFVKESIEASQYLKKLGIKVKVFWDNYKYDQTYGEIEVHKPNIEEGKNSCILICTIGRFKKFFFQQIEDLGCKNVYDLGLLMNEQKLSYEDLRLNYLIIHQALNDLRYDSEKNIVLPSLEIPITERCSLKCQSCSNLMQYFQNPKDLDVESTIKNIEKVINAVDYIEQLRFLGGEPFICKDLYRYIEYFKNNPKIGMIHIYTNGTIIPMEENLNCLKDPKIYISISNYGKISKNISNIEQVFQKDNILYQVLEYTDWTDCSKIALHNRTDEQQKEVFENCCANTLLTLRNGRIFACPFIANGWALQAIPECAAEPIQIDLYDENSLAEEIKRFRCKKFFAACDYCNGRPKGVTNIPAAVQTKEPLPYCRYTL